MLDLGAFREITKVDQIDDVGYVATHFVLLNFIPVPVGADFVIESPFVFPNAPKGKIMIPCSYKSLIYSCIRLAAVVSVILAGFHAFPLISHLRNQRALTEFVFALIVAAAAVVIFFGSYRMSRAGSRRANELVQLLGYESVDELQPMLNTWRERRAVTSASWSNFDLD